MQRFLRVLIPIATLFAGGLLVWSQAGTHRANDLVAEANGEIEAFNVVLTEAGGNFQNLFSDVNEQAFPKNRARWAPLARDTAALYEKSIAHARAAAEKFDAASKLPTGEAVAEYNRTMSEQFTKTAERCELLKEYTLLWVDPTLQTVDALTMKQTEINVRLSPVLAAEKATKDKSEQIMAAHASKFE